MALDLLRTDVTYALANNKRLSKATFDNALEEASERILVAISTSAEEAKAWWPWVTTPEATEMLGVTVGRIYQLIVSGVLRSMKEGRDIHVSRADVGPRLAVPPRTGRPRREPVEPCALVGVLSADIDLEQEYGDYLEKKYR
ncbi:MAG: helix-turn-helix domain-containing protein [Coriobacteriia bacterium]|nr:helix-turn-helix domain-containing protein [Coriobacteriia bacterium]